MVIDNEIASVWLLHLSAECDNVQNLLDVCLNLNQCLNNPQLRKAANEMAEMQSILRLSQLLRVRREELSEELASLIGHPANLSRLIERINPEYQVQLTNVRQQILDKLSKIQTISYSNQIVMNYTLSFYHQFLSAIVNECGGGQISPIGNDGRPLESGQLITKTC